MSREFARAGNASTDGAQTIDLVAIAIPRASMALIRAACVGADRSAKNQTIAFGYLGGGGIVGGTITMLPAVSGGTQRSGTLASASASVVLVGGELVLRVTGVAGLQLDWLGKLEAIIN